MADSCEAAHIKEPTLAWMIQDLGVTLAQMCQRANKEHGGFF
jgi:hypothetical protein